MDVTSHFRSIFPALWVDLLKNHFVVDQEYLNLDAVRNEIYDLFLAFAVALPEESSPEELEDIVQTFVGNHSNLLTGGMNWKVLQQEQAMNRYIEHHVLSPLSTLVYGLATNFVKLTT